MVFLSFNLIGTFTEVKVYVFILKSVIFHLVTTQWLHCESVVLKEMLWLWFVHRWHKVKHFLQLSYFELHSRDAFSPSSSTF